MNIRPGNPMAMDYQPWALDPTAQLIAHGHRFGPTLGRGFGLALRIGHVLGFDFNSPGGGAAGFQPSSALDQIGAAVV